MNRLLKIIAAAATLALPTVSLADLNVFVTQDPDAKKTKPPADGGRGWDKQAVGDTIDVPAGGSVWFACLNTEDRTQTKWFRIEIEVVEGDNADINPVRGDGFPNANEAGGRRGEHEGSGTNEVAPGVVHVEYSFWPQPEWERVEYKNGDDKPAKLKIRNCWSVCAKCKPANWNDLAVGRIDGGSFGSATPGALANSQRITQIWAFPRGVPVNMNVQPRAQFAAQSGQWQWNFAGVDPTGQQHPYGGVAWFCTQGRGLVAEDDFVLDTFLQALPPVLAFDVFAFDADANEYQRWTIHADVALPRRRD